jgi:multidrug efflux pump subunit AcrB
MDQAMSEVVAQVNRARSFMPPGSVAPFVLRLDSGSVPVGYIVLSSDTHTIDQIQEQAYIRVRPTLVSLPGVSAPPPFGGKPAHHHRPHRPRQAAHPTSSPPPT